jgi:hypothetical protein
MPRVLIDAQGRAKMKTITTDAADSNSQANNVKQVRMTPAMREGLDALQREYSAFVESSFQTLALISDRSARRE